MSNWRFVKEERIDMVKNMYKEYIKYGTPDRDRCDDYCVASSCKKGEFRDYIDKKCMNGKFYCVACWKEFFEFLDLKAKRNNLEVYDNV